MQNKKKNARVGERANSMVSVELRDREYNRWEKEDNELERDIAMNEREKKYKPPFPFYANSDDKFCNMVDIYFISFEITLMFLVSEKCNTSYLY